MASYVPIVAFAMIALCITVTTPPLPFPQTQGTTEGLGEQIGKFVDQMVQHGKDTIQKFIPQGAKGAAVAGPPAGPQTRGGPGGPPVPAVHLMAAGFVGGAEKQGGHGFEGHVHNAGCRNATS